MKEQVGYSNVNCIGFGIVVKGGDGSFVAALSGVFSGVTDPMLAEALGARMALQWTCQNVGGSGVIGVDAQQVALPINACLWYFKHVGSICNWLGNINSLFDILPGSTLWSIFAPHLALSDQIRISESLDKLGPVCRIVMDTIRRKDPNDLSSRDILFKNPSWRDIT
ncbi:hypothetical protein ACFE04_014951 [Oxalis oulophora]